MHITARAFAIGAVFLTALLLPNFVSYGQESVPSPTPDSIASNPDKEKKETQEPASAAAAKPAPTPESDFWKQETITGDWGGTRSRWKEKGVDLEFKLSNFYQGVASGGIRESSVYNGKFEMWWKFDLGKRRSRSWRSSTSSVRGSLWRHSEAASSSRDVYIDAATTDVDHKTGEEERLIVAMARQ